MIMEEFNLELKRAEDYLNVMAKEGTANREDCENVQMHLDSINSIVKKLILPVVVAPVKITKCKTFRNSEYYKIEDEVNEWLSSNKIVIKDTHQTQYQYEGKSGYSKVMNYGILITIFYEEA